MSKFDTHPRAIYWSEKNSLKPSQVALNSHKKFWFNCDKCAHDFESSPLNINQANNWCPYCDNLRLCGNCDECYHKSFASHPRAVCYSTENEKDPVFILKGSDRVKYKFHCDKCPHSFEIVIRWITKDNHFCSYCTHQKLCDDNTCDMCFNNSLASVERCKYLVDKSINPRQLFKSSGKKQTFSCNRCNQHFTTKLSDITNGVWCPYCYNKTETLVFEKLQENFFDIEQQYKVEWCKNILTNRYLPFDFALLNERIIIEVDGPQHFNQVGNWQAPEITRVNDLYKMKCANDNGFSVIRLLQKDAFHNKYDWVKELVDNVYKIIEEGRIQNVYMCKNNEYKDFVT